MKYFLLFLLTGCSISLGGGTTIEKPSAQDRTFIQDGIRWNCVVLPQDYGPPVTAHDPPWRKIKQGICYEVKP